MKIPYKPGRFLAALILPPLIGSLILALVLASLAAGDPEAASVTFVFTLLYGSLTGIPAMVVFGLPAHAYLCKIDKRDGGLYALLGAISGLVAGFISPILMFRVFDPNELGFNLVMAAFAVPTGAIAAALFHNIRGPHLAPEDI